MNRVAVKIKEARLKANMTEKQLAKKCGLSENYIIQIETGRKVINEIAADKILNILGAKIDLVNDKELREDNEYKPKEENLQKKKNEELYTIQPTEQWSDALANIIKKFPIYDIKKNEVLKYKELPILGKKIEGFHWEKIMFVEAPNNEMDTFRIKKKDIIMISLTTEIHNDSIYLFEMNKKKDIGKLRKETNNIVTISKGNKEDNIHTELDNIKVIGKCVKVEFDL